MRKLFLVLMLWTGFPVFAQVTHAIQLVATDPNNPAGTQYNFYRQVGACPTTTPTSVAGFTKLNSAPVSGLTFSDNTVVVGTTYCYVATAVSTSIESGPSPDAGATVLPFSPVSLTVTAK